MKYRVLVFFILIVSFIFIGVTRAEIIDKVIAVVNNEVITQSELDRILIPIYIQYKEIYNEEELAEKIDGARRELLSQMIEDKLILQEARKEGILANEEEIGKYINEIKNKFTNEEEFEEILASQNMSINSLKKKYAEQIKMKKIFERRVRSKVVVLPTQVEEYYKGHLDVFEEPETVVLRTIVLKAEEPENRQVVLKKISDIKKRLDGGENFEEMAREFSEDNSAIEGGLIGYVKNGQLIEELNKEVFSLKPNEISGVIESDLGFHIFKIDEKISAHSRSFEQVSDEIRNMLYQQKVNQRFEEWLDKLKKDAYISIK